MTKFELLDNEISGQIIKWDDNGTVRFIPIDKSNADYQRYLLWLENPEADEAQSL